MNRDFVWEAEYGRRSHLRKVFKDLLNMQNANSLQCLGLYVNNNPYNLEFFVVVSYDQPNEDDLSYMQEKFIESGLVYRQDLTMLELTLQMGNRRFNSMTLIDAGMVDFVMDNFFLLQKSMHTLEKDII